MEGGECKRDGESGSEYDGSTSYTYTKIERKH
jgi:hypothetical protein